MRFLGQIWLKTRSFVEGTSAMTKRGLRSQAYNEARLRRRIAVRILEYWHQSGYADNLAARAHKALRYLQSVDAPELKTKATKDSDTTK
jgi:hypothetical protein